MNWEGIMGDSACTSLSRYLIKSWGNFVGDFGELSTVPYRAQHKLSGCTRTDVMWAPSRWLLLLVY